VRIRVGPVWHEAARDGASRSKAMHGVPQVVSPGGYVSAVSAGVQCVVPVFEAAEARAAQTEACAVPVPAGGAAAPAGLAKAAFRARWSRATFAAQVIGSKQRIAGHRGRCIGAVTRHPTATIARDSGSIGAVRVDKNRSARARVTRHLRAVNEGNTRGFCSNSWTRCHAPPSACTRNAD